MTVDLAVGTEAPGVVGTGARLTRVDEVERARGTVVVDVRPCVEQRDAIGEQGALLTVLGDADHVLLDRLRRIAARLDGGQRRDDDAVVRVTREDRVDARCEGLEPLAERGFTVGRRRGRRRAA